jgi:hypothetical protein
MQQNAAFDERRFRDAARHEGGDHEIFVGRVVALRMMEHKLAPPLIFFGSRCRRLDDGFRDRPLREVIVFDGW